MESKLVEEQSASEGQTPRPHWTASLSLVLLLSHMTLCLFLFLSFPLFVAFQIKEKWLVDLQAFAHLPILLTGVALGIVGGIANSFARMPQWSRGRRIARIAPFVGGVEVFLLVLAIIWVVFFVDLLPNQQ
ncbi:MAG TPA: hypothetical protein VGF67_19785 [Ktedonobacteraceae bacterium]|jgi:hypothetical protein